MLNNKPTINNQPQVSLRTKDIVGAYTLLRILEQSFVLLIDSKLYKLALLLIDDHKKVSKLIDGLNWTIVNIIQTIDQLINQLNETINNSEIMISEEVQKESSKLLRLCLQLKKILNSKTTIQHPNIINQVNSFLPNLNTAFCAVNNNKNLTLATRIRRDIEFSISSVESLDHSFEDNFLLSKIKYSLTGMSNPVKVITGLFLALPFHLLAPFILSHLLLNPVRVHLQPILISNNSLENTENNSDNKDPASISEKELDEFIALLILSAISGSSGSVMSILSRLNEYRTSEYDETLFPLFVGAFKPMIGAFMGMFLFAILNSQLLPILIPEKLENKWFAVISLTFLIGFSERFANDLISKAENKVSSNPQTESSIQPQSGQSQ